MSKDNNVEWVTIDVEIDEETYFALEVAEQFLGRPMTELVAEAIEEHSHEGKPESATRPNR